jgi:hypothetical protein
MGHPWFHMQLSILILVRTWAIAGRYEFFSANSVTNSVSKYTQTLLSKVFYVLYIMSKLNHPIVFCMWKEICSKNLQYYIIPNSHWHYHKQYIFSCQMFDGGGFLFWLRPNDMFPAKIEIKYRTWFMSTDWNVALGKLLWVAMRYGLACSDGNPRW